LIFASLYQDKEVREKNKIIEGNTFQDLFPEIFGFYTKDLLLFSLWARRSEEWETGRISPYSF
jgi:hypothetical protein